MFSLGVQVKYLKDFMASLVQSNLADQIQISTAGLTDWIKAHKSRTDLIDFARDPLKSVHELSRKIRELAAEFARPGALAREPDTHSSLSVLATVMDRELYSKTRQEKLPEADMATFASECLVRTVPEAERDNQYDSVLEEFVRKQSKRSVLVRKKVSDDSNGKDDRKKSVKCPKCKKSGHALKDCPSDVAYNDDGSVNEKWVNHRKDPKK